MNVSKFVVNELLDVAVGCHFYIETYLIVDSFGISNIWIVAKFINYFIIFKSMHHTYIKLHAYYKYAAECNVLHNMTNGTCTAFAARSRSWSW